MNITFDEADRAWHRTFPRAAKLPEQNFIVEVTSVAHPELHQEQLVVARCEEEAIYGALGWMNIPSSWVATAIIGE